MLGFSVGEPIFDVLPEQVEKNLEKLSIEGVDSIEIFIHPKFFVDPNLFDRTVSLDLSRFKYISIHAPSISYGTDPQTSWVIEGLAKIASHHNASDIVVHPVGISDWSVFKNLNATILIENMDSVTSEGQDVGDLDRYFSQLDAGMVLDLQHTYSIDRSMELTERLINTFKERIKQVHISAWEAPRHHIPLYNFKDRELIAKQLEKLPGVRVIMEGVTSSAFKSPNADEILRSEVEFLKPFIK